MRFLQKYSLWIILILLLIIAAQIVGIDLTFFYSSVLDLVVAIGVFMVMAWLFGNKIGGAFLIHAISTGSLIPAIILGVIEGIVFGVFSIGYLLTAFYMLYLHYQKRAIAEMPENRYNVVLSNFLNLTFWLRVVTLSITYLVTYNIVY